MNNQKEKTIDGIKFVVTAFTAVEAFKLKAYLLKKFGPTLGHLLGTIDGVAPISGKIENIKEKIGDIKLDGEKMAHAIETLLGQFDEDDIITFLRRMLRNVVAHKDKKQFAFADEHFEATMDIIFNQHIFSVYPVLLLVLEVNYPDFFGKISGIGKKILATPTSEKAGKGSENESTVSETSES